MEILAFGLRGDVWMERSWGNGWSSRGRDGPKRRKEASFALMKGRLWSTRT